MHISQAVKANVSTSNSVPGVDNSISLIYAMISEEQVFFSVNEKAVRQQKVCHMKS